MGKTSDVSMQKFRCLCPRCPMFYPFRRAVFGVSSMFFPDFAVFVLSSSVISPPRSQPSSPNSAAVRCLFLSFGAGSPPGICQQVLRWTLLFVSESCGFLLRKVHVDIAAFCSEGRFVKGAFHGAFQSCLHGCGAGFSCRHPVQMAVRQL